MKKPYCYVLLEELPRVEDTLNNSKIPYHIGSTLQIGHTILIKLRAESPKSLHKIREILKENGIETYDIQIFIPNKFITGI